MENDLQKKFEILSFHKQFSPSITELKWPARYDLPLYEFETHVKVGPYNGLGRGSSFLSHDHAIEIALTESLERIVAGCHKIETSNGVAGHSTRKAANAAATAELIERHIFLQSFYSGLFEGQELPKRLSPTWACFEHTAFVKTSKNYWLAQVTTGEKIFNVVMNLTRVVSDGLNNGIVIGMGTHEKLESACQSAEIESARFLAYIDEKAPKSLDLNTFLSLKNPQFEDHGHLALNKDYFSKIEKILFVKEATPQKTELNIKTIPLEPQEELKDVGLYFAQATSPDCLPLITGIPGQDYKQTAERILGKNRLSAEAILLPHPLA